MKEGRPPLSFFLYSSNKILIEGVKVGLRKKRTKRIGLPLAYKHCNYLIFSASQKVIFCIAKDDLYRCKRSPFDV